MRSNNLKRHQETCVTDRKQGGAHIKNKKISESEILNNIAKTKKSAPKKDTAVAKYLKKRESIVTIRKIFMGFLLGKQMDRIDKMSENHKLILLLDYEDLNAKYSTLANYLVKEPAYMMNLFNDITYAVVSGRSYNYPD